MPKPANIQAPDWGTITLSKEKWLELTNLCLLVAVSDSPYARTLALLLKEMGVRS